MKTIINGPYKRTVPHRLKYYIKRKGYVEMGMNFIDIPISDGYFLGKVKKKLRRLYSIADEPERDNDPFLARARTVLSHEYRQDRHSKNPRRMDNPYELEDLALVKWNRRYVLVPMDNVLKETYNRKTRTI